MLRLFIGLFFLFSSAFSASAQAAISYRENNKLDFGNVTKQQTADVNVTVTPLNNARGDVSIKDGNNSGNTINITFQSCGLTSDKIELKDFSVTYAGQNWTVNGFGPFTQSGLPNPGLGGTNLRFGGTLRVTKDANIGALQPCFEVSMQYDCAPSCSNSAPVVANLTADVLVIGFPIVMNETQQMSYGKIIKPTTDSRVVLDTNGGMNVRRGDAILSNGSGQAAIFDVTAEKNAVLSISAVGEAEAQGLALSNFMASLNNGTVLAINNATNFSSSATSTTNVLKIGARLNINAAAVTEGQHSVGYNISIDYQ
jgi:hypothetical protein